MTAERLSETENADPVSDADAKVARGRKRRAPKPSETWMTALLAPHKAMLRRKAWLEVGAGLTGIPIAASLALGVGAIVSDNEGVMGVLPYALTLFGLIVLRAVLSYFAGRLGHQVSSSVKRDLRLRLAHAMAARSPLEQARKSAGEMAALGSDVVEALDAYASRYLSLPLQLAVTPLVIALAAASVSWAVALILLVCGPLIPVFMALAGIRAQKASDAQIDALSDMSARFLDRISGMTTLRLFGAVGRARSEFETLSRRYRQATMRVLRIAFLSSAALELFAALGIALSAIFVAYQLLGEISYGTWGAPITISSGLFLVLLAPDFFSPLREFAVAYHDKASALSAADRLRTVIPLASLSEAVAPPDPSLDGDDQAPSLIRSIEFQRCDLGYGGARGAALHNISCRFEEGERIALVGASGAGKSTMLAALCGFLTPTSGSLLVNDAPAPVQPEDWTALRRSICWIGQRPHIFHGSVLMNARLAKPAASREAVTDALAHAHADHFVARLPRTLLTRLGETGFGISGGQIRRLAIARAALSGGSLVLCDEPTSDLDGETAALVTQSLLEAVAGRLLVIATHDRTLAGQCDRIFLVADGALREISKAELDALSEASLLATPTAEGSA